MFYKDLTKIRTEFNYLNKTKFGSNKIFLLKLLKKYNSIRKVAKMLDISQSTIQRKFKEEDLRYTKPTAEEIIIKNYNDLYEANETSVEKILIKMYEDKSARQIAFELDININAIKNKIKNINTNPKKKIFHLKWLNHYNKTYDKKYTNIKILINNLINSGYTLHEIANLFNCPYSTLLLKLNKWNINYDKIKQINKTKKIKNESYKPTFEYNKLDRSPCINCEYKSKPKDSGFCENCEYLKKYQDNLLSEDIKPYTW